LCLILLGVRLVVMSPVRLRVRELREVQGLTGAELARRAKVRPSTLSAIENHQTTGIDFDTLDRLAVALGVDAGYLIVHTRKGGKR
jgi:transcriptional regulator with XRE-family HTH domain